MTVTRRCLDPRSLRAWIVLLPLGAVAVACGQGATEDRTASAESGVSVAGPWRLPADVRTAGERVDVSYDAAPRWTGTSACSGGLKEGARRLGASLIRRFDGIQTVGGYACRRNTASSLQMSVHGTGRALDLMIPRTGGNADNSVGDPIANWLVTNAARIGVQMIIWDQTVWRADGRGASAYGGPNPHTDHIHVEITNAAASLRTPFFTEGEAADDPTTMDPNAPEPPEEEEEEEKPSSSSGSSGTTKPAPTSSGSSAPKPAPTPAPTTPTPAPTASSAPAPSGTPAPTPVPAPAATSAPSSGELEVEDDPEPGETDSLGTGPNTSGKKGSYDESYVPVSSCAASTMSTTSPPASGGAFVTVALGALVAVARRRRR